MIIEVPPKYVVIEVGCLECTYGDSDPKVIGYYEDYDKAVKWRDITAISQESDRFMLDLTTGVIVK